VSRSALTRGVGLPRRSRHVGAAPRKEQGQGQQLATAHSHGTQCPAGWIQALTPGSSTASSSRLRSRRRHVERRIAEREASRTLTAAQLSSWLSGWMLTPLSPWRGEGLLQVSHESLTDRGLSPTLSTAAG